MGYEGEPQAAAGLSALVEDIDELVEPVYAPYATLRTLIGPGTTVLDVGCGNGKVGAYLARSGAVVDGIEPSDTRVDRAKERLRYVSEKWAGPDFDDPGIAATYDLVTFLDVLEHIVDPAPVLEWAVDRLAPGGQICALIPNSAHWSFRLKILRGDWTYAPYGLFDQTHLRFYDPKTMEALQPRRTTCVGWDYSSFGRFSHPRLLAARPAVFATHVLARWQLSE